MSKKKCENCLDGGKLSEAYGVICFHCQDRAELMLIKETGNYFMRCYSGCLVNLKSNSRELALKKIELIQQKLKL